MVIQSQMVNFNQLAASMGNDPAKNQFFQTITGAVTAADSCNQMIEQGTNFYMKLNGILIKLQEGINDFKFSRDL